MSACLLFSVPRSQFEAAKNDAWLESTGALDQTTDYAHTDMYVRRPTRGFQIKEDSYASLSVSSGAVYNSSAYPDIEVQKTYNFLLQSITEVRNEKSQFVTTFGATYAFFYGEQPRIINCAAVLLDSADFRWEHEWWLNYDENLRGTSLVTRDATASLKYNGVTITGYLMSSTTVKSAQDPHLVQMNFTMFVSSVIYPTDTKKREFTYPGGARTLGDLRSLGVDVEYGSHHRAIDSTTAEVRKANIALLQADPGFLSKVSGSLDSVTNALDSTITTVKNFLFGTNLVIPQGFSSARAHKSVFPAGSGAEELAGTEVSLGASIFGNPSIMFSTDPSPDGHSVTIRIPGVVTEALSDRTPGVGTPFTDNIDEYVVAPAGSHSETQMSAAEALKDLYERMGVLTELELDPVMNAHAVSAFKAFGIDISSITESAKTAEGALALSADRAKAETLSQLSQIGGRLLYGAVSLAAMEMSVNAHTELQATITNPNTGNLTAAQLAELESEISAVQQTAAQEKLAAEAQAAELRGNTGTTFNTFELVVDAIL